MNEGQEIVENQAENSEDREAEPVKRSFIVNRDNPSAYEQRTREGSSGKRLLVIIIILMLVLAVGYFAAKKFNVVSRVRNVIQPAPVTTPVPTSTSTPAPTSQPILDRSDWSLEVLNGSGVTGAAKSKADKIQALGYPVVKTGNADKDNYLSTQIFVQKSLQDKIELVIADLKDIIRIASVAGELKDSTASARIIIGKDRI